MNQNRIIDNIKENMNDRLAESQLDLDKRI